MENFIEKIEDILLNDIGIELPGEEGRNGSYIIDIGSDVEWGKIYTLLENNENIEQADENNLLTTHNASLIYRYNNEYLFNLKADFDHNLYSLVCSELI